MVETEEGQAVTGRRLVNAPDVDTRQLPRPARLFLSTGQNRENEYLVQKEIAAKAGITTTPHTGSGVSVFQAATLRCAAVASPEYLQEFQGGLSDRLAEASDTGWQYRDGGFELPDRPGIGIEINEALLEPFIVKG